MGSVTIIVTNIDGYIFEIYERIKINTRIRIDTRIEINPRDFSFKLSLS